MVVIEPLSTLKASCMVFITGTMQLVVHEPLLTTFDAAVKVFSLIP
jgi:hypothetical protein